MAPLIDFFVYGTLKPGEINHRICADFIVGVQPAIAQGNLYHLPFGYPAMTLDETGRVHGYILTFANPAILSILDEFEQHCPETFRQFAPAAAYKDNQYSRKHIPVVTPKQSPAIAWGYIMTREQIMCLKGTPVLGGQWSRHLLSNEYCR